MSDTPYPFESEEAQRLDFLPLAMRWRLDQLGLHVSLKAWQALPLEERRAWLAAGVEDEAMREALGRRVARALAAVGHAARPEEAQVGAMAPWRLPEAREAVVAAATRVGVSLPPGAFEGLGDLPRFVLCHLAAKAQRAEAFAAALRHFQLDACTSV